MEVILSKSNYLPRKTLNFVSIIGIKSILYIQPTNTCQTNDSFLHNVLCTESPDKL